jgi:hypothetical protein
LNPSNSRYSAISPQSAEVVVTKNDSKSVAYENRNPPGAATLLVRLSDV